MSSDLTESFYGVGAFKQRGQRWMCFLERSDCRRPTVPPVHRVVHRSRSLRSLAVVSAFILWTAAFFPDTSSALDMLNQSETRDGGSLGPLRVGLM